MNVPMTDVVALERDLFFASKIRATLQAVGRDCQVVRSADDLAERLARPPLPALVMVHCGAAGVDWLRGITLAREAGVPVLAYGAHVDIAAQSQARAAGATRVIANSKLAGDLLGQIDRTIGQIT
jgi:DNA-binding NtrC family response regulator